MLPHGVYERNSVHAVFPCILLQNNLSNMPASRGRACLVPIARARSEVSKKKVLGVGPGLSVKDTGHKVWLNVAAVSYYGHGKTNQVYSYLLLT